MCVVAQAAPLEHCRLMRVNLGETILSMAIKTATFEHKTATPVQFVALAALHVLNRWMLMKRLKGRGRIRTNEEMHFLLSAFPQKNQRMHAGRGFDRGVKDIGKWPF